MKPGDGVLLHERRAAHRVELQRVVRRQCHVHAAPVELLESAEYESALEQEIIRECFARPHVRIRPEAVRLTSKELLPPKKKPNRPRRR